MIGLTRAGLSRPLFVHDEQQAAIWEERGFSRIEQKRSARKKTDEAPAPSDGK